MPKHGLIFDLDGTLADTAPDLCRVLDRVMGEQGLPAPDQAEVRHMVGEGARVLLRRAFDAAGEELTDERLEALFARFLQVYTDEPCVLSAPYPGVRETLERLREEGWVMGVCTNKPQRPSELLLRALDLDGFFAATVGGDALPHRKPDPRHLTDTAARMDLGPDPRLVFVGDSRADALAAQGARVPCVLVTFGYSRVPVRELPAAAWIERFEDLPKALENLPAPA